MNAITDEEFAARFFSVPNATWPGQDPSAQVAATLKPFLDALTKRGECPLILPRREESWSAARYYVICWDTSHAGRVRALLDAATASYWSPFDGRVTRLNLEDPVEAAVLDLVGQGTTFILRPEASTAGPTYKALARLVRSLNDVPLRTPTPPKPIGRLLREFDLALASGSAETSAQILHTIETLGGISHENVAFLQIRRMARLGRDGDLLAHGSLPTLVFAEPPQLVREGILGAWIRANVDRPIDEPDIGDVLDRVREATPDVAMLVDTKLARSSDPDAVTLGGLVALIRGDADLVAAFASNDSIDESVRRRLLQLEFDVSSLAHAEESDQSGVGSVLPPNETPQSESEVDIPAGSEAATEAEAAVAIEMKAESAVEAELKAHTGAISEAEDAVALRIDSWTDWVRATGPGGPVVIDTDQIGSWPPAADVDAELAKAIDDLDWLATDDLLSGIASFLDSDEIERPASRSAEAFLRRYLLAERFTPADLGVICSLLDVVLRGAPSAAKYREVLGDVRASSDQWVSIATASRTLDLADTVVLGPATDAAARADFVATLLSPLNQQKRRMDDTLRGLAGLVTSDIGLVDFDWSIAVASDEVAVEVAPPPAPRILLYSLDEGTLGRVQKAIQLEWPAAIVRTSSDKDGSPMLKQHARNSDLIVVATRRAAHAATGCIADNAGSALITYPDGAGSASMLRAVAAGVAELTG